MLWFNGNMLLRIKKKEKQYVLYIVKHSKEKTKIVSHFLELFFIISNNFQLKTCFNWWRIQVMTYSTMSKMCMPMLNHENVRCCAVLLKLELNKNMPIFTYLEIEIHKLISSFKPLFSNIRFTMQQIKNYSPMILWKRWKKTKYAFSIQQQKYIKRRKISNILNMRMNWLIFFFFLIHVVDHNISTIAFYYRNSYGKSLSTLNVYVPTTFTACFGQCECTFMLLRWACTKYHVQLRLRFFVLLCIYFLFVLFHFIQYCIIVFLVSRSAKVTWLFHLTEMVCSAHRYLSNFFTVTVNGIN